MIAGTYVMAGELSTGMSVMKDGVNVAVIKDIQENKESVGKASVGKSVAVAYVGPTAGRQVDEGDILYSVITEEQFRQLRDAHKQLSDSEKNVLKEIAVIMRKQQPMWGV
jgi:translation initiation factor 5B